MKGTKMLRKLLSLCLAFALIVVFLPGCQEPKASGPDSQKPCCAKKGDAKKCDPKKCEPKKCPMSGKTKGEGQK
jgi:hypothetical protein